MSKKPKKPIQPKKPDSIVKFLNKIYVDKCQSLEDVVKQIPNEIALKDVKIEFEDAYSPFQESCDDRYFFSFYTVEKKKDYEEKIKEYNKKMEEYNKKMQIYDYELEIFLENKK